MGNSSSRRDSLQPIQPLEIGEFRNLDGPLDFFVIPEVPEKRKTTDKGFVIILLIFVLVLFPFLIYSFTQSDLDRFIKGYDDCGNVCGKKNAFVDGISCSGVDETMKKFLKITPRYSYEEESSTCVESCDPSNEYVIMNRCFPKTEGIPQEDIYPKIIADLNKSALQITLSCFVGLGLSVGLLFLFRYFTAVIVWITLAGSLLSLYVATWYCWQVSDSIEGQRAAVVLTIVAVVITIIVIFLIKKVQLIIRLFKETIQVVFAMPLIFLEPLLTLLASLVLFIILVSFASIISMAGDLQPVRTNLYEYIPNGVILFTLFFHIVMCLWFSQIIIGCQHMVISGAVSAYYFARDKKTVVSPIYYSFYNLIRYHLGTVIFGSLILTIITLIKLILRSLANSRYGKILVECCIQYIENIVRFISHNAYIQTAMHGQSFCKSGKRAVEVLAANFLSTVAVNSIGDFILGMCKIFLVLLTVGFGFLIRDQSIEYFALPLIVIGIITAIISHCIFSVFEIAVDTIFMCYCEDSLMNDGLERPYYMTTNLKQFFEDSKKRPET